MPKPQPTKTVNPPSPQSIEIVMTQAANAPIQNLAHAAQVDKAFAEVAAFFRALYPQIKSQTGAANIPQAPAKADGKPNSQA